MHLYGLWYMYPARCATLLMCLTDHQVVLQSLLQTHACFIRASGGVQDNGPRCLSGTPSLLAPKTCRAV
jgi:hypothetical protein